MTYIENIFLCLALPLILSLFFMKGRVRRYALFLTVGMAVCLLSAYVSSFFMGQYGVDGTVAAIEITPVCEEVMKLLPLLFFYLIFETPAGYRLAIIQYLPYAYYMPHLRILFSDLHFCSQRSSLFDINQAGEKIY